MQIRVENIYKAFGKKEVYKGLDLVIPEGKISVILGGSGQGKSVLLKHIVGLMKPDKGTIHVGDRDVTSMKEKDLLTLRTEVGMVFQSGGLLNSLNVKDNVALGLRERKMCSPDKIDSIVEEKLAAVHMEGTEDIMPSELSGGMRKRVSLARALTMTPKVILYDEPTSGLDPPTSDTIDNVIKEMNESFGVTSVIVTHDLVSVFRIAHQVFMLKDGEIIMSGTPEELKKSDISSIQKFLDRYVV